MSQQTSGLMEDVMDLQFALQAMLRTGGQPLGLERIEYLLSDKFSSKIGSMEEANELWVPNNNAGSGSTP